MVSATGTSISLILDEPDKSHGQKVDGIRHRTTTASAGWNSCRWRIVQVGPYQKAGAGKQHPARGKIIGVTLSEEQVSMDHPPEQNDLKKFQSGEGVVKMASQRKRGYGFFSVTPCLYW